MKKSLLRFGSVLILVFLLLHPSLAFQGAKKGLLLWAQVVLPTLLPFMICSNMIVSLGAVPILIFPFRPLLSRILSLSDAGCYIFVTGLLCGYPMGAKTCSEFMDNGTVTTEEGQYLLSICNHPSPMFLLGYMAVLLPQQVPAAAMIAGLYLPVFIMAPAARKIYCSDTAEHKKRGWSENASGNKNTTEKYAKSLSFDQSLLSCFEVMIKIGGYIMIFSILALYISNTQLFSPAIKAAILGSVEITTGIQSIAGSVPEIPGAVLMTAAAAFGGLSGIFQTKSVIKNAGLSIRHYTAWKLAHCLLSCLILILLLVLLPPARQ